MIRSALAVRRLIREEGFECVVCDTMYGGVMAARLGKVSRWSSSPTRTISTARTAPTNPIWRFLNVTIRRYLRLCRSCDHPRLPCAGHGQRIRSPDPGSTRRGGTVSPARSTSSTRNGTAMTGRPSSPVSAASRTTSRCTSSSKRLPTGARISSSMSSIPAPNCRNPRTTSPPTGMSRTCTSTSRSRRSRSSMAASPPSTRPCSSRNPS